MVKINRHTIVQVLGGLMQKPELLSDSDKYCLEVSDFTEPLDKYVFSAIYNLYINGAETIHVADIDNYLQTNSYAKELLEKENGLTFLKDCENEAEVNNFDFYYNELKKLNLIRELKLSKNDIDQIYCENVFDENYTQINENFKKMKPNDIINFLKSKVAGLEKKYLLNNQVEESRPCDSIDERLAQLKESPEIGCMLQGEAFNTITRGGRKGKLYLRSAGSGVGKCLPNYLKIPTTNGWSTVGKIKEGDYLFDRLGNPTKVLKIYPQKEKKLVYKIYFKSGKIAECCNEHLWSYYSPQDNKLQTSTLKSIYKNGKTSNFKQNGEYCYCVPISEPVQMPERNFKISPYIKGLFLGIQSLDYKSESIPEKYLFSSIEQRMELLRGFLDAKSHFSKATGEISYSTTNEKLKNDFVSLCSSLGILTQQSVEIRIGYPIKYKIILITENCLKVQLFKTKRKRQAVLKYLKNCAATPKVNRYDPIINIEPTENYVDMTCFYVDNEEHLFAAGDSWWITHNTRSMVGDACAIAYPIRFDPKVNQWVSTGSCEKVLYVMTEQDPEEIDTMVLAYLSGYNEDVFTYGTFDPEDPRIIGAAQIMKKFGDNMNYARVPDPCSSVIKNLFRRKNLQEGIENIFYDYIFSCPAMLNEYRDLKLREDVALRLFTTTLKNLAVELNAFIMTSTQLSNEDENVKGGFRDFRNIQGSRAIVNLMDFACIMTRPSKEELTEVASFKSAFGFSPNLVTDVFKNRRGRWNMIRVWSFFDRGVCQKTDLFITTDRNKPIENFQIVHFETEKMPEVEEYLEYLNLGVAPSDIIQALDKNEENNLTNIQTEIGLEQDPDEILTNFSAAFGEKKDQIKRIQGKRFSDLI